MNLRLPALFAVGLFAASFAAGCHRSLDKDKLEGLIKSIGTENKLGIASVSCPADRPAKQGDEFECTGELDDKSKFVAKMTQTDDQGTVKALLVGRVVNLKAFGEDLEKKYFQEPKGDVKCSEKVILLRKGDTFTCDVTVGESAASVVFTATSDEGDVDRKVTPK
jgi:hypothetical protein